MATTKTEKYYRLVLLLAKGCTKLVRKVTIKHIESFTPLGQEPYPWTVDQFLEYHKDDQCMKKLNVKQKRVLYADTGTDIEEWDLQLLCFVLEEYFTLTPIMKMDIRELRKLRNKLCHQGDPGVSDSEYQSYMSQMKVIIDRFMKILKDDELTKEIHTLIEQIEHGALSLEDTTKTLKAWFDRETREEKLERLEEGQRDILNMVTQYDPRLELLQSGNALIIAMLQGIISTKYPDVTIPDTNLRINIENCNKERESDISKKLITFLDPKLRQCLSDEALINNIKESVAEALEELLKDGKTIVNLTQKCVEMRLKCPSFQSLKALWTDCAEGTITTLFQPVQQAIRQLNGCENVRLEVIVTEKEFWRCLEVLVSDIARVAGIDIGTAQDVDAVQTDLETTSVRVVAIGYPGDSDIGTSDHNGTQIKMTIKPNSFSQLVHIWHMCKSGRFNKRLEEIADGFKRQYDLDDLSIKAKIDEQQLLHDLTDFGATENKEKRSKDDDICPSLDEAESEQDSNRDHSAGVSASNVLKQRIEDKETKEQIIAEQYYDMGTCGSGDIDQSCSSGHMVDLTDKKAATENKEKRSKDDNICPSLDEAESEQDSNRDYSAGVSASDVLKQRIEDKETKEQIIAEQYDDMGACGSGDIDQSCSSGHMVDLTDKKAVDQWKQKIEGEETKKQRFDKQFYDMDACVSSDTDEFYYGSHMIETKDNKAGSWLEAVWSSYSIQELSKVYMRKSFQKLQTHFGPKDRSIQNWHTCLISAMIEMLQAWIDIPCSSNSYLSTYMVGSISDDIEHFMVCSRWISVHVLKRVIPDISKGVGKQCKVSVVNSLGDLQIHLRYLCILLTNLINESKRFQMIIKNELETEHELASQGSYKVVKKETHKEEKALLEEVFPVTRFFGDNSRINVIDKDRYETNLRTTEIYPTTTKTAVEKEELLPHPQDHIEHLKIFKKKETDSAEETVLEVILSLSRPFDVQPTGSVIDQVHHKKHELPETILKQQQDHDDAYLLHSSTVDEFITQATVVNGFWKNMIDLLDSIRNDKMDAWLKTIEDRKYTKQFQTSLGKVKKSWEWLERICDFYETNKDTFLCRYGFYGKWRRTKSALQDIKTQFEEELHAN